VALASAGLYASLHLIPDNHANIPPLSFLQAGCPSCRPTNSVKALKAKSTEGKANKLYHTPINNQRPQITRHNNYTLKLTAVEKQCNYLGLI